MRHIPTREYLNQSVRVVEVEVEGTYIAFIDEKRRTKKRYKCKVMAPEGFNMSEIKRVTPKALKEQYEDFYAMREFEVKGNPKTTDKKMKRSTMYSRVELQSFERLWDKFEREQDLLRNQSSLNPRAGAVGDTTEYNPDTGLPDFSNK